MDKQREKFERWCTSSDCEFSFAGMEWDHPEVISAWQAWQAAQKAAAPDGWVSVEDRLPEIVEKVLIEIPVCGTFNVESGKYIGDGEFYGAWCTRRGRGRDYTVSRWMPRP
jgi:hypothetical protein